ncbi:MAG: hypothetical protein BWK76_25540 [Desulfobulbaceae bacterium A2]|nr:MAG: hypothetical protein BWK76_25540 [Desulfobulbaceae bacterium A2]
MVTIPFPQPRERRICLPVAPRALARGRFVTTPPGAPPLAPAVSPAMALKWLEQQLAHNPAVSHVEIHGPGDPLADAGPTLETLDLVRQHFSALTLSLRTLGLGAADCAESLHLHGVRHVTLLVDALDPVVLQQLYSWIRPGKHTMPLARTAVLLAEEQQRAVPALVATGCTVEIAVTIYPTINDGEVGGIARRMAALGAASMTLIPGRATSADEMTPALSADSAMLARLADEARQHLPLVEVAAPAQAALAPVMDATQTGPGKTLPRPGGQRPNVAVVSSNGMEIDLHLGQAMQLLIYGPREDGLACLLGSRPAATGSGTPRWEALAESLSDCCAILATSAGDNPRKVLADHGITVLLSEGDIAATVDVLYGGGKKGKGCKKG